MLNRNSGGVKVHRVVAISIWLFAFLMLNGLAPGRSLATVGTSCCACGGICSPQPVCQPFSDFTTCNEYCHTSGGGLNCLGVQVTNAECIDGVCVADTPTATPTDTPTTTPTLTATVTDTATETPTTTPTGSPTDSPTITLTATPTATPTVTQTGTVTNTATQTGTATETPTATPTKTPVPNGGGCTDTSDCVTGNFCVDDICCSDPSCPFGQSCDNPGHVGMCADDPIAPAPALSPSNLLLALAVLVALGGLAMLRRRRN